MLTLVFDTETTGLPPKKKADRVLANMPYIIQLAAILYKDRRPVGHFSAMMEPKVGEHVGTIPDHIDFWKNNQLTTADISDCWMNPSTALTMFMQYVKICDRVVAFNTEFDRDRIDNQLSREEAYSDAWSAIPKYDPKIALTPILKIPSPWGRGYKWPSLDEAYRALVDPAGFEDAHDAMADVQAAAQVLFAMEDKGIAPTRI